MGKKIFSGVQPTGNLHLGNYLGAIKNFVDLNNDKDNKCIFCVVDLHAITVRQDPKELKNNIRETVATFIASGIDPKKSIIFNQSRVAAHAEGAWILSCVARMGWLNRMTQFKEKAGKDKEKASVGLYIYPILMAADILLYDSTHVPVGEDQAPHLEMSREIARKFNRMYGEVFPEPETLIGKVGRLSGTDGKGKMSKSQGNVILLSDSKETVEKKVRGMYTDPNRIRADIPGKVEGNPVFQYLDAFTENDANVEDFKARYKQGNIGDVEIKTYLANILNVFLDPIREKRAYFESNMNLVEDALDKGVSNARISANETMELVRDKMKVSTYKKIW